MDAVKKAVIATVFLCIIIFGLIIQLGVSNLTFIPNDERGTIQSKTNLTDGEASYIVTLTDGKTLFILNNTALFLSLQENQTYAFSGYIDFYKKMAFVDSAKLIV